MKIRIVKPGAQPVIMQRYGRRIRRYNIEDTVEIDLGELPGWYGSVIGDTNGKTMFYLKDMPAMVNHFIQKKMEQSK